MSHKQVDILRTMYTFFNLITLLKGQGDCLTPCQTIGIEPYGYQMATKNPCSDLRQFTHFL